MRKFTWVLILFLFLSFPIYSHNLPYIKNILYDNSTLKFNDIIEPGSYNYVDLCFEFNEEIYFSRNVDLRRIIQVTGEKIEYSVDLPGDLTNPTKKFRLLIYNINKTQKIEINILNEYIKDEDGNRLDGEYIDEPSDFFIKFYVYKDLPVLIINKPKNQTKTFQSNIDFKGTIYPADSLLKINNNRINLSSDGRFLINIPLDIGKNSIKIYYEKNEYFNELIYTIYREKKKTESIINIIAGQTNTLPVPPDELDKLKIYTFEGKHLGDVSNIYNSKWNGEINNKYLKTGIYIYIIENKKDEILKTGRLKYLNEK